MIELAPQHKHGLVLANPVMNASGTLGFGDEYRDLVALGGLGAFVTNALTFNPRTPARPPNAVIRPNGVLVHTGLPNPGVRAAVRRYNRDWLRLGAPVIVHLAATTAPEVARALEHLEPADGVSGIELGLRDEVSAGEAAQAVRAALGGPPVLVRLPVERAPKLASAVAAAGANALTVGAPPRVTLDLDGGKVTGRWYSPECFPAALEAVRAVAALGLGLPLIAASGIYSVEAAQAVLAAGAVAVQVDAAVWQRPNILSEIVGALVREGFDGPG